MKILFISHACVSQAHQEKLAELAKYSDIELFLIAPRLWEEETRRIKLIKRDNLNFTIIASVPLFTGRQFVHFYPNLAHHLRRINPDIIHLEEEPNSAISFQTLWLRNKLKLKARVIQFTWQNMFQIWKFPNPRSLFYPFFERYSLRNADYIIAGNKEGKDIFLKKGYAGGINIIPQFGINPDEFKKIDVNCLKQKLGLNKFVIGYLGRLLKMKGLYTLLNAVSKIKDNYHLLIIGDGPEKGRLKIQAEKLGIAKRTVFMGAISHEQVPLYLNCMDVLVLPSGSTHNWKEQFGRVLVEAMACEVPVIGSTCGEIPNVIGDAGLIFEEGNYEGLRAKLEMIITSDSLRVKLAEKGRQRVLDNYTTRKIVRKTYQIYVELLSNVKQKSDSKDIAKQMRTYYKTCVGYLENLKPHGEDYFDSYASWILDHAPKGAMVLDLGCGSGLSSHLLNKRGLKVTGLDISYLFLQQAGKRGSLDLSYVVGDAVDLPFKNESFDAVSSISLIEHIPNVEKALLEMIRVIKTGGVILIMAPNLLSPFAALTAFFQLWLKRGSMPGFASTKSQAASWLFKNLVVSWKKKTRKIIEFLYRQPDLSRVFTGDIDSVYLACQMDLKYFFKKNQMEIVEYAYNKGLSFLGRIAAKLFPNFCGACSIVVKKPSPKRDVFYESKWAITHRDGKSVTSRITSFFSPSARFTKRFLSRKGKVLDLGCGGGKHFYTDIGTVTGVDLSLDALFKAKDIYDIVAQADALKLPFKDEAFDYVVSHDLIGHIPTDKKEKLVSEIYRVLKKGGLTVHYIEAKGNNLIERIATRFPELYQRYFIDQDGHYGLEPPTQAIERFRSKGFKPVAEKKWASTFLRFPKEYLKRFDNEYAGKSVFLAVIVGVSRFIRKTKILERPAEVLVLVSDRVLKKFSSFDDSSGIYVCYEK